MTAATPQLAAKLRIGGGGRKGKPAGRAARLNCYSFRSYLRPSCKGKSHFSLEVLEQTRYFTNPSTSLNTGCSAVHSHSYATLSVVISSAPFPASRSNAASRLG